jgi:hypothetical protein
MYDLFSKYVKLFPLRKAVASTIVSKIDFWNSNVCKISSVLSDNGPQFLSHVYTDFLHNKGIKIRHCSPYTPKANPSETVMRILNTYFRIYANKRHTSWISHVPDIETCHNNVPHETTGFSPFEILYGTSPEHFLNKYVKFPNQPSINPHELHVKVKDALIHKGHLRNKRLKSRHVVSFDVGDQVLVKTHFLSDKSARRTSKFEELYSGPYIVNKAVGNNAYELKDPDTDQIIGSQNVVNLKRFLSACNMDP